MIGCVKYFKAHMRMSFKTDDKKLFKRYTEIWEKTSNLPGREFNSKPCYDDEENDKRYINFKIKIFNDDIAANFHGKETPKRKVAYDCFSLITLDSVIRRNDAVA